MIGQNVYEFDNAASGYIVKVGSYYVAATGWDNCNVGQSVTAGITCGAFFSFDTSNLPDHAQIDKVEFRVRGYRNAPIGNPQFYDIRFKIGDIIGGSLDGTAAEWAAGAHMITLTSRPADKTTLDLSDDGNDPTQYVDKSGDTDISIIDHGVQGTGDSAWWAFFNASTTERCKLYVWYSVPSAELSASGSLEAAGEVIRGGTAELAGEGELDAAAIATYDGAGTLDGLGDLGAAGGILHSTASGTLAGEGELVAAGIVFRLCAAILAGEGSLTASPNWIASGDATLDGIGDLTALAALLHSTASATLEGIGTLTAAGGISVPPLAYHLLTIAVSAVDSDSISVSAVDSATIAVELDTLSLGPRSNI